MLADLPIFGICGYSDSGKTTLIEQLIPRLSAKGLKVAVVKHDAHGIVVDKPGKDSDRFFRSGADVFLQGPQEEFFRFHTSDHSKLPYELKSLTRQYDMVLVEGRKNTPLAKVWLLSDNESKPPSGIDGIIDILPRDTDRVDTVMSMLDDWLPGQWLKTPVFGCVLIGGRNTRMGTPKHLIVENGKTWLEKTICILKNVTQKVVIAGAGDVPDEINGIIRLPDVPDIQGPMSGILSAMRWAPYSSWLMTACDQPYLSPEALRWLLSTRRPGVWATLPASSENGNIEPLLAHYDFRSHILFEQLAAQGDYTLVRISDDSKVIKVSPPCKLAAAWTNINTKAELKLYKSTNK